MNTRRQRRTAEYLRSVSSLKVGTVYNKSTKAKRFCAPGGDIKGRGSLDASARCHFALPVGGRGMKASDFMAKNRWSPASKYLPKSIDVAPRNGPEPSAYSPRPDPALPLAVRIICISLIRARPVINIRRCHKYLTARREINSLQYFNARGVRYAPAAGERRVIYTARRRQYVGLLPNADVELLPNADVELLPNADVELLPNADVELLPNADVELLPNADVELLPNADVELLPNADVELLPNADVELLPNADVELLPNADVACPPNRTVREVGIENVWSYNRSACCKHTERSFCRKLVDP
ncbi:S-antigen protein [Eumeta japonica]|uniref:S-antigen protein n=1 Tax=Eumeta variegata TaxID=151549 RepID=A0A4C1VZE9_EUMVA|nr:S-antigen protein [Eumeta japonica]